MKREDLSEIQLTIERNRQLGRQSVELCENARLMIAESRNLLDESARTFSGKREDDQ